MGLRESEVFAPRRRRGKPERAVQRAILLWLKANGYLVAVTDAGAARAVAMRPAPRKAICCAVLMVLYLVSGA